ncbi:uncharacterized protein LOC130442873 [Diorhabda sublineata]|uniref:uncharacterized protein LOC130442873 n=1 Tax=Diorhabda sublineata TaxID=1163346 RepID=UPI0024E04A19|nr:uncharacterized protein LOC130442873 [Diorhabda sublineata]
MSSTKKKTKSHLTYTREQKIVAAVWYHEKQYTGLTGEQIRTNFFIRFKTKLPRWETVREWERTLFENNQFSKKSRISKKKVMYRLAYIPYIKESFQKYPNLSLNNRAHMVGISTGTLNCILKHDFLPEDLEEIKKYSTKDQISDQNMGNSEECSIESSNENSNTEPSKED